MVCPALKPVTLHLTNHLASSFDVLGFPLDAKNTKHPPNSRFIFYYLLSERIIVVVLTRLKKEICTLGIKKVVVGCINGVFLSKIVLAFCWAKKSGRNNEVVVLTRWS